MNKSLVAAFALFTAPTAFAGGPCPDLSGTYACQGDSAIITITQADDGDVTTYEINGQKIVVDSQPHQAGDSSDIQAAETYACLGGALIRRRSMGLTSTVESFTADAQGLHIARSLGTGGSPGPQGQQDCARRQ